MPPLAVFDIDGTLTQSTELDDRCFVCAMREVFGISGFSTDWLQYRYSTDSGILGELLETHRGWTPDAAEQERFRRHFHGLLQAEVRQCPQTIVEVPGAARMIARLQEQGWQVAVATGTWRCSAEWKLRLAGIDAQRLPMATADDAPDRAEIIRQAVDRAISTNGQTAVDRVVYVGDGVWDYRSARQLGIGFVGVGTGPKQQRLREAGTEAIVADYADASGVLALLEREARPLAIP
jgi:phosphoglycolate phosphatase-like HAD superfamily hydrolase